MDFYSQRVSWDWLRHTFCWWMAAWPCALWNVHNSCSKVRALRQWQKCGSVSWGFWEHFGSAGCWQASSHWHLWRCNFYLQNSRKEDLQIKRKMNEAKYHQECVVDVISWQNVEVPHYHLWDLKSGYLKMVWRCWEQLITNTKFSQQIQCKKKSTQIIGLTT